MQMRTSTVRLLYKVPVYIYTPIYPFEHDICISCYVCERREMETAVGRTFSRRHEDLSHNRSTTAEGTQEKGRSNNASLNYDHLDYSRLSCAHNKRNNEFESALCLVFYSNNSSDNGTNTEISELVIYRSER